MHLVPSALLVTLALVGNALGERVIGCGEGLIYPKDWLRVQPSTHCTRSGNHFNCDRNSRLVFTPDKFLFVAPEVDYTVFVFCNEERRGKYFHCTAGQQQVFNNPCGQFEDVKDVGTQLELTPFQT
ncbi:hypothetical protein E4U42_002558 [Claviceps africana]|uniref:Uncharacterized protein n=1 Tax=Claviceps africana TaxID=83212 RepID=A0A8K0NHE7_9HYPO|nr:hypothetical protein E4U42_002558 [Claviceps africana]